MFSLQRLLGKEDKFFDLLEASANEAHKSAQALTNFLENPQKAKTLDEFIVSRRAEKRIADQISEALCTTFVTALEREDIEALSLALYKIPKTVEKIAERILIAPHLVEGVNLGRQVVSLGKATDTILEMIRELRGGTHLERIKEHNDRLQVIEGEADKVINQLLSQLYNGSDSPIKVVFLKDIFELLEKVVDRCRDAGNVINHIVLKNSKSPPRRSRRVETLTCFGPKELIRVSSRRLLQKLRKGVFPKTCLLQNNPSDKKRVISRVTAPQSLRFLADSKSPLQPAALHPARRLLHFPGMKIKSGADPNHQMRVELG
jgi:uncharacterized protein